MLIFEDTGEEVKDGKGKVKMSRIFIFVLNYLIFWKFTLNSIFYEIRIATKLSDLIFYNQTLKIEEYKFGNDYLLTI
jgi:hypothetical protein